MFFKPLAHFFREAIFLSLNYKHSSHASDTIPLSHRCFASIFSHSVICFFVFFKVYFKAQKVFILVKSTKSFSFFCCLPFWGHI